MSVMVAKGAGGGGKLVEGCTQRPASCDEGVRGEVLVHSSVITRFTTHLDPDEALVLSDASRLPFLPILFAQQGFCSV